MSIIVVGDLVVIKPSWQVPSSIKAYSTTRLGGKSSEPFHAFNLGLGIDDNRDVTISNREKLVSTLALPEPPRWISQTHSTIVHDVSKMEMICEGDASFTTEKNQVCAVLTADCLPIVLANPAGTFVAAIHAGWRGLLNGIIEKTLSSSPNIDETAVAWLAPAISQQAFEVGPEVKEAFLDSHVDYAAFFIDSKRPRHFYADLYGIARMKLLRFGLLNSQIYGGNFCTYSDAKHFYSYRRDGKDAGRQATLVWME